MVAGGQGPNSSPKLRRQTYFDFAFVGGKISLLHQGHPHGSVAGCGETVSGGPSVTGGTCRNPKLLDCLHGLRQTDSRANHGARQAPGQDPAASRQVCHRWCCTHVSSIAECFDSTLGAEVQTRPPPGRAEVSILLQRRRRNSQKRYDSVMRARRRPPQAPTAPSTTASVQALAGHPVPVESLTIAPGLTLKKGIISNAQAAAALGSQEMAENDLIPGEYEGGFKQWEGGVDLAKYLAGQLQAKQLLQGGASCRAIELGCGHGLPSLVALRHGAEVHCQVGCSYWCSPRGGHGFPTAGC